MPFYTVSGPTTSIIMQPRFEYVVLGGATLTQFAAEIFTNMLSGTAYSGTTTLMIHGTVAVAEGNAVRLYWADATPAEQTVLVGPGGSVIGGRSYASIAMAGGGNSFQNFGQVTGGTALYCDTWANGAIENHGTLAGIAFAGIKLVDSGTTSIVNTGLITGPRGIELTASAATIVNDGEIRSNAIAFAAIDATTGSAGLQLTNAGLVSGPAVAIRGAAVLDRIVNSGAIHGDVLLNVGNDVFLGLGGQVEGEIRGGIGNDYILGGTGDDTILGEAGLDRIGGGRGDDTLTGGTSPDTFIFRRGWGDDVVTDFVNGQDKVGLASLHLASFAAVNARAFDTPGGLLLDFTGLGGGTLFLAGMTKALFDATDVVL